MATPLDLAKFRSRRAIDLPGRPLPEFNTPPAFPKPSRSEIDPGEMPGFSAEDVAAPRSAPAAAPMAARKPNNWRAALGAALQGAAYGAQAAPAGTPGQEFRQALVGGITGIGQAAAARERAAAAALERDRSFAEKMALIDARLAGKETPEEAAERARLKAEALDPIKARGQERAAKAVADRMQRLKKLAMDTAKSDEEKEGWKWSWDRALEEAKMSFLTDGDEINRMAQRNFAYWKAPKAPSVPKLPD